MNKRDLGMIAIVVSAAIAVLGISTGTQTNATNQIGVREQTATETPDGKSTTSFEAKISEDGANLKVEQTHEFNISNKAEEKLEQAHDTASNIEETSKEIIGQIADILGQ
jgi:maltose-binding protein MalE